MKLNLGAGRDYKQGYVNVDFDTSNPVDQAFDLSAFPWPWADESADEIQMLDFLEHFPYAKTEAILAEVWRVLKTGGKLFVQVPDFEHCSLAILNMPEMAYQCNACGWWFEKDREFDLERCGGCNVTVTSIQESAVKRLYGGQDRPGNWHYTTFTNETLSMYLRAAGFDCVNYEEYAHQLANWNMKLSCVKTKDVWDE